MTSQQEYEVVDLHAAGEPARVVFSGVPYIPGNTIAEKRRSMMNDFDHIRKVLLQEPRGYPCQNANIIFQGNFSNNDKENEFGFVIMEQGKVYPMMSGHNTICVATALLETGRITMKEPVTRFTLHAPAGEVDIEAKCQNGKVISVSFTNVPSFVAKDNVKVEVPELGIVSVDVVYGGMWYAVVDASKVGLKLLPSNGKEICRLGEMIKVACREQFPVKHPENGHTGCEILVFREATLAKSKAHAKNAVVMSNGTLDWNCRESWTGMLDRSPCGTGTCAVMALMYSRGELRLQEEFIHESIVGTTFVGKLIKEDTVGDFKAVVPQVSGQAWITAKSTIIVHNTDPFPEGYTVSDIWA